MLIEESFAAAMPIERARKFVRNPDTVGPRVPGFPGIGAGLGPIETSFTVGIGLVEEGQPIFTGPLTAGGMFAQALRNHGNAA